MDFMRRAAPPSPSLSHQRFHIRTTAAGCPLWVFRRVYGLHPKGVDHARIPNEVIFQMLQCCCRGALCCGADSKSVGAAPAAFESQRHKAGRLNPIE